MKVLETTGRVATVPHAHVPLWHSYEAALNWLFANRLPEGGIAVSSLLRKPYPEVTGYIVPTLLDCGETEWALELTRWLISIQRPDGAIAGHDGEPYLFDTGQIMRGLVATINLLPESAPALRKAADWMLANGDENGVIRPKPTSVWSQRFGDHISENIHLYTLSPLMDAGRLLNEPKYIAAAQQSLDYYTNKPELTQFKFLTHFYGYVLEALVDLGRQDLARVGLQPILDVQRADGTIPGVPGAQWMCSPGSIQMSIVGYKLGLTDFADATLDKMQQMQTPSGGFQGSYGPGAAYAVGEELSWACKYFLDACHWRIQKTFDQQKDRFAYEADDSDPRLAPVLAAIGGGEGKRILDVGCGRGSFLRALQKRYPTADLTGVDISQENLNQVPAGITTKQASMLNLPFPDAAFDAVLCIEALEHAIRIERALDELCRVTKPGGQVVVIDKDVKHLGLLKIEKWEKWFDPDDITLSLKRWCSDASYEHLQASWDDKRRALFVVWKATRSVLAVSSRTAASVGTFKHSDAALAQYRESQKHIEARLLVQQGFTQYQANDLVGARKAFVDAIRIDQSWLKNRGVLSILMESMIGSKAMSRIRRHKNSLNYDGS